MRFGWDYPTIRTIVPFGFLIVWSLVWKALALWRAAKEDNKYWYIAMIVLNNTAGILEIAYLFFFAKEKLTLSDITTKKKTKKKKK